MSIRDHYGFATTSPAQAAGRAFEEAILAVAGHRPQAGEALARTLASDPDHVGAHVLAGFANLILARDELLPAARHALAEARRALLARDGGTADERVLVEALSRAAHGRFGAAADTLDEGFARLPTTLLPFKLSHALRFMVGDAAGMLAASSRMLADWSEDTPGAGFLLGCHAFALEEHGRYDVAERFGRLAVALEPDDAWGLHAVGHVHEMRGEPTEGIAWLEAGRPNWSRCNNFSFHMAWHLALFHLEAGDQDRVLALYDEEVRPRPTDDFRDMANAVSLLWRLEAAGCAVGDRWEELAAIARRRRSDRALVFAQLHGLAALLAVGDRTAAGELVAGLQSLAASTGDQAEVATTVGLPLARILTGENVAPQEAPLTELARLGGSNAQRDLFVLALANAARARGNVPAMQHIRAVRRRLKAEDRLIEAIAGGARRLARTA